MAELAAVASIIQIADVGFRLSVKLFAFAETVASADKAIVITSKDVSLTSSVLKEVGEVLRKDQTFRTYSPEAIKTATAIVTECSEVFQEMERVLVGTVRITPAKKKVDMTSPLFQLDNAPAPTETRPQGPPWRWSVSSGPTGSQSCNCFEAIWTGSDLRYW